MLQALAVKVLTISENVEIRGMKHEVTMGNICSSNNNNKVVKFEMSRWPQVLILLREARNLPEIWHVFSRRAKKEGPGLIYLDNFSSIEIRYHWDVHCCFFSAFLSILTAKPSKRTLKPIFPFPDWSWQWAPVLCSSRESKICAWKIWISSQGGIEGGAGEHIAQDRCHSFCVWCTRACFTCQPGTILKLLN